MPTLPDLSQFSKIFTQDMQLVTQVVEALISYGSNSDVAIIIKEIEVLKLSPLIRLLPTNLQEALSNPLFNEVLDYLPKLIDFLSKIDVILKNFPMLPPLTLRMGDAPEL